MERHNYRNLFITMAASFVVMYIVMYMNVNEVDHVYFSITRLYMTILMTAAMAVLMLLMMQKMYTNKKLNLLIISGSIIISFGAFIGVHRQYFVNDRAYLKAMIPHHSIAIMTSQNARLKDPEVRALADSIASAQIREISQMKKILHRLEK